MADPLLAIIGAVVVSAVGIGAFIALIVLSAQIFLSILRAIGLLNKS